MECCDITIRVFHSVQMLQILMQQNAKIPNEKHTENKQL